MKQKTAEESYYNSLSFNHKYHIVVPSQPNVEISALSIELSEWKDHRILALCNNFYYPGVIKHAVDENVFIELDQNKELIKLNHILSSRKYDIIKDVSPSLKQITIDSKVCFRHSRLNNLKLSEPSINVFSIGTVRQILVNPTRFVIEVFTKKENYLVRRADLRLLQPPWWDELEEKLINNESSRPELTGNFLSLLTPCFL